MYNGIPSLEYQATAVGGPSGGTYSWSVEPDPDGGYLDFVSGQNSDTVTFKGFAPSSNENDVRLKVTYTYNGHECTDTHSITVYGIATTTMHKGELKYDNQANRFTRNYYHQLKDQFGFFIDITGIPCDEIVTKIYGEDVDKTGPGETANWPSDGDWQGGIAIKDVLSCPGYIDHTQFDQQIKAGGWNTDPDYYIWLEPTEPLGQVLWKTTH